MPAYAGMTNRTRCNLVFSIAHAYARYPTKKSELDVTFTIPQKTYLKRNADLQPWLKLSLLEEIYFALKKNEATKNELDISVLQIAEMSTFIINAQPADQRKNLFAWYKDPELNYINQTLAK